MQVSTHQYTLADGWDRPLNPALDSVNTWALIFCAADASPLTPALDELRLSYPRALWTGCSTSGEICGGTLKDNSLTVSIVKFADTRLRLASVPIQSPDDSAEVGAQLGRALDAPDLKAVFLLSDGLCVNGSSLIEALSSSLTANAIITGGLAGDGDRFQKTWVLKDQKPQPGHVTAQGFYGEKLGVSHGSKGGWDVLGPEREVTRSESNVLFSLDGKPALDLYKQYLGDRASGLPATGLLFPLALRNELEEDGYTARTILAVDEAENSITFAGDIPQGSTVRLMRANFERLIDGAGDAAEHVDMSDYTGGPLLNVAISCIGRRLVLGQRTEEEIEAERNVLPQGSDLVGYYSYGELSPLASGRCSLHNQTMTLSSFWEK